MEALISQIQDEAQTGEFDDLSDIMGELGGRPQELFWKEDSDGTLYVGDDNTVPSVCARIALTEFGEFEAAEVDASEVEFARMTVLSRPESAIRDRQFD
jgi:hypothetical protein